ncbi:transcriptional regulator [Ahniella affigens]|uniref:Transcriptional regulator n=1 Tax=Ahniella affigens TaxID=2021234 RepID=A0A2P1PM91_9GAMM|nr:PTS sugar transporter subunit IIA [Ahniella affigens]AVP95963.1 transcriptional regulator [Ahniella affigens]
MAGRLRRALTEARINLNSKAGNAEAILAELGRLMAVNPAETGSFHQALLDREHTGSTALGNGVAVPHARVAGVAEIRAAFVRTQNPIGFASPDGEPVDLFFGLIVPVHANTEHLELLAEIAELLSESDALDRLRRAKSAATIQATLLEPSA